MNIKKALSFLIHLPIHPQWLHMGNGPARKLLENSSGIVLDVGCADRWAEKALPASCEYIGLDYPPTGQVLYKSRPTVFADAAVLPFLDGSIDTVTMLFTLEHFARPDKAIAEAARVLRAEGLLLMTVPFFYPMHDEPHDYQRFTKYGLMRDMKLAGLEVKLIEGDLSNIETAGLMMSLSLGGMAKAALDKRSVMMLFIPVLALLITVNNCACWLMGKIFPDWTAVTNNFQIVARKAPLLNKEGS